MKKSPSILSPQMRWLAILLGMVFLFWLPFEDQSTTFALFFSLALSAWGAALFLSNPKKTWQAALPNYLLAGTLAGLAVTPLTLFWLTLKTGLHSHPTPDFTYQQFLSVIARTPIWLIGGFLVGLGSGLWLSYRKT